LKINFILKLNLNDAMNYIADYIPAYEEQIRMIEDYIESNYHLGFVVCTNRIRL